MSRMESIGEATLWQGDCMEILPRFDLLGRASTTTHVITDPPYESEAHGAGRRLLGRTDELKDARVREIESAPLDFAPMDAEQRTRLARYAAQTCNGWLIAFCQAEAVSAWREAMEQGGAQWRRAMVWVKPDSSPQLSGDRPAQGYESIAAAWCGKGGSKWNGGGKRGVFTYGKHDPNMGHGGGRNEHPTQKPQALMSELVSLFTNPGDFVIDPYMGSGTTGVVCAQLRRPFFGIEQNPRYFDIACRRIEQAYAQRPPFEAEPAKAPEQLGLEPA